MGIFLDTFWDCFPNECVALSACHAPAPLKPAGDDIWSFFFFCPSQKTCLTLLIWTKWWRMFFAHYSQNSSNCRAPLWNVRTSTGGIYIFKKWYSHSAFFSSCPERQFLIKTKIHLCLHKLHLPTVANDSLFIMSCRPLHYFYLEKKYEVPLFREPRA